MGAPFSLFCANTPGIEPAALACTCLQAWKTARKKPVEPTWCHRVYHQPGLSGAAQIGMPDSLVLTQFLCRPTKGNAASFEHMTFRRYLECGTGVLFNQQNR